jgi:hypothetical protein
LSYTYIGVLYLFYLVFYYDLVPLLLLLLLPILLPRPILLTIPVPIPSSHIIIGWNKKSFLDKNNRFMLTCFGDGGKMVFVGYCMIEVEKGGFMGFIGTIIAIVIGLLIFRILFE